ncbi:MAG TPA: hypothetical protein PLT23_00365 [Lentisphaeria bacterium]|nr:hypothetical protein [Lentisphaeria bacterium]
MSESERRLMFSGRNHYLGLDIGASGPKALVLRRHGKGVDIAAAEKLDIAEEGILTEKELYQSVRDWLQSRGWAKLPLVLGTPQCLSTTLVSDFPAASPSALSDMVKHEARQLASLSDEAFVHDYQPLPAGCGRQQPVLIGLCREQTLRERLRLCADVGLRHDGLAMTGLAMVSAYCWCHPEAAHAPQPVLLLDLGKDNSTAVVLAGGQPLFIGSLLFNAERFQQALATRHGASKYDEKPSPERVNLLDEAPNSALLVAARQLETEIHNAVEHWRNQEQAEMASALIEQVYVCGGGSLLGGLDAWLADRLESRVEVFGPRVGGVRRPEFVVALGLALQAAGEAELSLSLLPADIAWRLQRERRWPWLAAALALVVVVLGALEASWWQRSSRDLAECRVRIEQLSQCGNYINGIEQLQRRRRQLEAELLPLVITGNQARRATAAIAQLGRSCADDDWFIYLADEASYHAKRESGSKLPAQRAVAPPAPAGGMFGATAEPALSDRAAKAEFPALLSVFDLPCNHAYIAAGYTPLQAEQPFEPIRNLVRKLNAGQEFRGVDQLSEQDRMGREDIFRPWMAFFKKFPKEEFKSFSFRLPLAAPDVRPLPAVAEEVGP